MFWIKGCHILLGMATTTVFSKRSVVAEASLRDQYGDWNNTFAQSARLGLYAVSRPSWVQGIAMSAILELEGGPKWSLFSDRHGGPIYAGSKNHLLISQSDQRSLPLGLWSLAYHAVSAQDKYGRLCAYVSAEEQLAAGASLDSSNCASGVLLAAFAEGEIVNGVNKGGYYGDAANKQYIFDTKSTQRATNGAISQRNAGLQTWSDSFYMASSLAVYGSVYDDQKILQLAYDQMRVFRNTLIQPNGLMAHIYDYDTASFADGNVWVTGNGWAAAGMLRVLVSIIQSSHIQDLQSQRRDLFSWISQLLDAAYKLVDNETGQFHNYMNMTDTFIDSSGSMLLAYSTFRLASMTRDCQTHLPAAERIYQAVQNHMLAIGHFDDGLTTVNALNFAAPGPTSGEALAFSLMLASARRDYHACNVTGFDGPHTSGEPALDGTCQA